MFSTIFGSGSILLPRFVGWVEGRRRAAVSHCGGRVSRHKASGATRRASRRVTQHNQPFVGFHCVTPNLP